MTSAADGMTSGGDSGPTPALKLLYTAEEASVLLAGMYSPEVLWRKAGRGEIDCTRIGKPIRFSRKNLEAIIAAHERTAANFGRKKSR